MKRKNCGRRSATEHKLTNTEFVEILFAPKIDDICWSCTYVYHLMKKETTLSRRKACISEKKNKHENLLVGI